MSNIGRSLAGLGLTGILSFSGCSLLPVSKYGGVEPKDMSKSSYANEIKSKANQTANSSNIDDLADAAKAYGFIGDLEKMDQCIKKLYRWTLTKDCYIRR